MDFSFFGRWIYRRPALCYEKVSQTLLIFAERYSTSQPLAELIMMRKVLVRDTGEPVLKWEEFKLVKPAHLDGHHSRNPCPVFDEKKQKLFLFFTCVKGSNAEETNKPRLCYVSSEDFGVNWSDLWVLTGYLPEDCITFSVGPGHGLQTETRRLIVPAVVYMDEKDVDGPVPHAMSLFSDSNGEHWQLGRALQEKSTSCQMAEVWVDDRRFIYCNTTDQQGLQLEAFSHDDGGTFTMSGAGKLPDNPSGVQKGVVSFPAQNTAAAEMDASQIHKRWLLFSQPIRRPNGVDLAVFVNKTPSNPKAWSKPWILKREVMGHSDLAYIEDGFFVCAFEDRIHQIILRRFHFSEINFKSHICRIM